MASGDTYAACSATSFVGAGSTPATPDVVEHGTDQPVAVFDFDSAQTEEALTSVPMLMPGQYDGTSALYVIVTGSMDSANTSDTIRLDAKISRLNAGQDLGADGFAAAQSATGNADDAADEQFETTIAFTNAQFDGVQPNEWFLLYIQRDHDHAGDTAAGDFQLLGIEVQEQ